MVPGSFGWAWVVLAAMTTLAPSLAAFSAMALPIPRLAPVMKSVQPASFLSTRRRSRYRPVLQLIVGSHSADRKICTAMDSRMNHATAKSSLEKHSAPPWRRHHQ
ncbi:Transcription factor RelB [Liparis tanakae]|uniref:Transcription factor RelB n=1 Tax=Liparis tanakae TaxID=230148 RepID=A0A4Z2IP31_9TELE|nr:Transcription factor RelB [Liparis tanakae]